MLIKTMLGEVRRALGYPAEALLTDASILMEIWGVTTFYRAKLRATAESWQIGRWMINVPAGTPTETNIDADNFANIIMIKTVDPNNISHIPRMVDFVKPEQMTSYWSGPDNLQIGGGFNMPHVAACFAPFQQDGQWKIAWAPAHLAAAQYEMWYSTGADTVPPIFEDTSEMPIEEQNFFLIADTSLNLFGAIADPEKGLNERQKLLMATQKKKTDQWAPFFEEQRWNGFRREPRQHRKIFGESRDGRMGRNWG